VLLPRKISTLRSHNFRLIKGLVNLVRDKLVDQEEVHTFITSEISLNLEAELLIVLIISLTLIGGDLELSALARLSFLTNEIFNESLVSTSDNFVQVKFIGSNQVVARVVL